MDKKISHIDPLETKSADKPLFVLRYRKRRMIVPILGALFIVPIMFYGLFGHAAQSILEFVIVKTVPLGFLLLVIPALGDMLLVKEIRLYRNRIVKAWKLIGAREMELANVGLKSRSAPTAGVGSKYFFTVDRKPYWGRLAAMFYITGITYQEHFADQKQVRQMNSLLAELSGRKVEEFEQTVTMERLIIREEH